MKIVLLLSMLFVSTMASAADLKCGASYAAGFMHVFKGEARQLGDKEILSKGEKSADEMYTFSYNADGSKSLTETQSGQAVELKKLELGLEAGEMYSTSSLTLYPKGVPGTFIPGVNYIIVMCIPADAL